LVLKPGALFVATGEPSLSLIEAEKGVQDSLEETHEGIVERRPKPFEYWRMARQGGFRNIQIDVFETYRTDAVQVYGWIVAVRQKMVDGVRLRFRPIVWLVLSAILVLPHRWAARLAVFVNGGNLFIRGTKS
jgi:hypothetical protein